MPRKQDKTFSRRLLLVTALIAPLAACSSLQFGGNMDSQTTITDVPVDRQKMLSMLNDYRAEHHLPALQLDTKLNEAARDMAHRIARKDSMDTWAHSKFGLAQRLDSIGYANYAGAENLGAGYPTLEQAFTGWQNSPHHNANLLNKYVTKVGIARTRRSDGKWRNFWVMELSRPASDGPPKVDGAQTPHMRPAH